MSATILTPAGNVATSDSIDMVLALLESGTPFITVPMMEPDEDGQMAESGSFITIAVSQIVGIIHRPEVTE